MRIRGLKLLSNLFCVLVGIFFIFSGFVKVVDPWGTALKVNEYLAIYGLEWLSPASMTFSIWLCDGFDVAIQGTHTPCVNLCTGVDVILYGAHIPECDVDTCRRLRLLW